MKLVAALWALLLAFAPLHAQANSPEEDAAALSAAAVGNSLPPLVFTDTTGKSFALPKLGGKPILVSLIYTGCADVCPAIIENLYPAIDVAQDALGEDSFSVITVGFDTRHDTPERMRSFARSRGVDLPNWEFLSGDHSAVSALAKATGFSIFPSAGGFDHSAQVSIFDADGKLYQQVRGGVFSPQTIVEPLKDLMFDRRGSGISLAGIAERVKLFCTVYNPNTGRYYFNYSLFIGLGIGIACLLLVLMWLVREYRAGGGALS